MATPEAVEVEPARQVILQFPDAVVVVQVDFLILHRAPKSLNEHVVQGAILTVHTDPNVVPLQHPGELHARVLTPLIGVEYFRLVTGR